MLGHLICCSGLPKQAQFQRWVVVFKVLKCSSAAQDWQTSLVPLGFRIHGSTRGFWCFRPGDWGSGTSCKGPAMWAQGATEGQAIAAPTTTDALHRHTQVHKYYCCYTYIFPFESLNPIARFFLHKLLQTNLQHPIHDCKSVSRKTHLAEHQHGLCSLTQKWREILQEQTKMKWRSGGRGGGGDDHGVMMTQKS